LNKKPTKKKIDRLDMIYKFITVSVLTLSLTSIKCIAQNFDSVHVYAVYMKSLYRVKMDKDLIKNEIDPIVLTDEKEINSVYSVLIDTVKGGILKKLKSNRLEINLCFEFFKGDKVARTVGVTPYNTMYINYVLYAYDKQKLKYLDRYITGLSGTLGIK